MSSSRFRFVFLPLLLVSPVVALVDDEPPTGLPFPCSETQLSPDLRDWISAQNSGAFTRTIHGNFDGLGGPDVVVRRSNGATMFPNLAYEDGRVEVPLNVADMATFPGTASAPNDRIAVVNASGVHLATYNRTVVPPTFSSILVSSAWAGAKSVVACDVGGDGLVDLIGISSNSLSILRLDQQANGTFVAQASVQLGGQPIRMLRAVEWDGDASTELAAITATGWGVVSHTGASLGWITSLYTSGDCIAVVGGALAPNRRLAHIGRNEPISSLMELKVLRPDATVDGPILLGDYRGVSMMAADLRHTGFDDLAVNVFSAFQVLRIENQRSQGSPTGVDFAYGEWSVDTVSSAPGPQPSMCQPVVADLDLDGSADLACCFEMPTVPPAPPSAGTKMLVKLTTTPYVGDTCEPVSSVLQSPFFRSAKYVDRYQIAQWITVNCPYPAAPVHGARVMLHVDTTAWGVTSLTAGQRVEVVLWRMGGGPNPYYLESTAFLNVEYAVGVDIPSDNPHLRRLNSGGFALEGNLVIEVPVANEMSTLVANYYFFQIRLLEPGTGLTTLHQTFVGAFAGYPQFNSQNIPAPGTPAAYIQDHPGALWGAQNLPLMISSSCHEGSGANQNLGTMTPQARVPKLPSGLPPEPGQPSPTNVPLMLSAMYGYLGG